MSADSARLERLVQIRTTFYPVKVACAAFFLAVVTFVAAGRLPTGFLVAGIVCAGYLVVGLVLGVSIMRLQARIALLDGQACAVDAGSWSDGR